MPMRELKKKYRRSELAILAWRSGETQYNMMVNRRNSPAAMPEGHAGPEMRALDPVHTPEREAEFQALEARMGPDVVARVEDPETGSINLRRLRGDQAVRYLSALGVPVMPVARP
jgi:hypothetical protein